MNIVTLNSHRYSLPARWEEVTDRAQFIRICGALFDFETGLTSFDEFKIALTVAVIGIGKRQIVESETLFENIWRISEITTFPYEIVENTDGSRTVNIKIALRENLLGEIDGVAGYRYHTDASGVVDTNLTAEQYTEALQLLHLYGQRMRHSRNQDAALEILTALVHTLYPLPAPHYQKKLTSFSREEKIAVFYNYRGIMESIQADPDYDLIFRKVGSGGSAPSPVGSQGSIFALSKAGLGDIAQIRALDVHTFLAAMVQQTLDSIHTLAGSGMKPGKIAEKLNLYTDQVLPYVTIAED